MSKTRTWTGRILSGWIALFLLFDGTVKLLHSPAAVEATTRIGFPARLMTVIGIVELLCLALYLAPRTSVLGAVLLTGFLGGATATQVRVENFWFVLPVAIGVLAWIALFLRAGGYLPLRLGHAELK